MAEFKRLKELEALASFIGNKKVNIIAGLRRCGKTYLLTTLFPEYLIKHKHYRSDDIGIIKLSDENRNIKTITSLKERIDFFLAQNIKILLVDEPQLIKNYAQFFIDFVKDNPLITLYISGSNSDILSKDIIKHFKELANPLYLHSLTYKEIIEDAPEYSFEDYIFYGGLPIVVNKEQKEKAKELQQIYEEIYRLDIRDRLENKLHYLGKNQIDQILVLLAANVTAFSPKSVATRFAKGFDNTKFDLMLLIKDIEMVIEFLEDSFLISNMEIDDYDKIHPLANLGLNKKYYFTDNGMRFINAIKQGRMLSICLENAVYLNLISKGITPRGKLFINKMNLIEGEIDFNYQQNDCDMHIQVCYAINESDYNREILNLKKLPNNSKKMLIYVYDLLCKKDDDIQFLEAEQYFNK